MLKIYFTCAVLLLLKNICQAQPFIHSHNDYKHAQPFWDAYNFKASVIEADVFCVNGELMVAHNRNEIIPEHTLKEMYIQPVVELFDTVDNSSITPFCLMIDIKENTNEVLGHLIKLLQQHPQVFDRSINRHAVQVFISGERPPDTGFHTYPACIMFDGLPGKNYTGQNLEKIVMISDNFRNYSAWNGNEVLPAADSLRLENFIRQAHAQGKPIRLWGAPDNEQSWQTLVRLQADFINTDRVKACREFLDTLKENKSAQTQ